MPRQVEYIVNKSTRMQLTSANQGAEAIEVGRFPVGTQVRINATVNEVFDGTDPKISVGTSTTENKFLDAKVLTSVAGFDSEILFVTKENERDVVAKITGADATVGSCTVTVDYVLPTNEEVSY